MQKALEEEKSKRRELQKELELQVNKKKTYKNFKIFENNLSLQMCLKAEMEVAMKLLEKDIHDKQDTIVSLRRQLDDIKLINLEMYRKLQVIDFIIIDVKFLKTAIQYMFFINEKHANFFLLNCY